MINDSKTYTYNNEHSRLKSSSNHSYSYDNEGQQTLKDAAINYSFDAANRLTAVDGSSFVYDGVGNRIRATRNGVVTKYIYDAAGNLLAEANNAGQITRYYIYGLGLTAMVKDTGEIFVYHFDGTGHTVALTNSTKVPVNRYAYSPYGEVLGQDEQMPQPFKYAGQVGIFAESNTLYYMRARYYDAETGRFISEDPAGFVDGPNLYAYVGRNRINAVDPNGLETWGLSGNFSAGWGAGGTFGVSVVVDDKWNIGVQTTLGGGGTFPDASLTAALAETNASDIYQLEGLGGQLCVGGGEGIVGETGVSFGKGYSGTFTGGGIGEGTPISVSGYITNTSTLRSFNVKKVFESSDTIGGDRVPRASGK